MAIFNSYVKLPEGNPSFKKKHSGFHQSSSPLVICFGIFVIPSSTSRSMRRSTLGAEAARFVLSNVEAVPGSCRSCRRMWELKWFF